MNDAVAIIVETNPNTFRENRVPIVARRIVVVEKRCILMNERINMSGPSMLSPPVSDRSNCAYFERPLQTYFDHGKIFSERLKTRIFLFFYREYTFDALRFALPHECIVDLG